ncbi:MAG: LysM peptidoglycan-binding domain-containing protein [Anaerolineae bacterium]|nr:LysM peptidoglycan-binding domain-containing protein [Anaerolineae bacterium]MDQ7037098.1 LysM peptidoglycan-binding domain-containing protein [Anaerolineae bacterium]
MFKLKSRWQLGAGLLCVVLVATACFQSVGDVPQSTVVSQRSTPIPPTLVPTLVPTEETEEVSAQVVDQPIAEVDTSTPTPTLTSTATNTSTSTPTATLEATQVAQSGEGGDGDKPPDPFQLTATELIRTATEGVNLQNTATAAALGIVANTATPTFPPTIDPLFLSLTPQQNVQPTTAFVSGADCVHEVRAGETMYRYSQAYGLPVSTIAAANGIVNGNVIIIAIGQRIVIPGCGTTGFRPPATSTPIPTSTPFGFGTGGFATQDPGTGGGFATTVPVTTSTCGGQYVVQQYETLFQISLACNVPVQSIANANGIIDINRIEMGTTLVIPPG